MNHSVAVAEVEEDLRAAIDEAMGKAKITLGIIGELSPQKVVSKIKEYVSQQLDADMATEVLHENSLHMGALWGEMVVQQYAWTWKYLDFEKEGVAGIYIVSPQNYYCCPPLFLLNKIMLGNNQGLDGRNDNTVMLLFNMIDGIEKQKPPTTFQVVS